MAWPCPFTPPEQHMWYIKSTAALRPQKTLNSGKRIKRRSSFSSGAPQAFFKSNIFTPFFLLDGKQHMVCGSLWVLMWHSFWDIHPFIASRPWCAAVEEGGGELENITGPSPWDTHAETLGKVRNRLSYDPTRIYIYFRIFWGQLPELDVQSLTERK